MEIVFLAGAEDDLLTAWIRYEELLAGLGDRFEASVKRELLRIVQFPESAARYAGDYRRLLVPRYDHGVFYRVHGHRIVISAVLDLRQDPTAIQKRLGI